MIDKSVSSSYLPFTRQKNLPNFIKIKKYISQFLICHSDNLKLLLTFHGRILIAAKTVKWAEDRVGHKNLRMT